MQFGVPKLDRIVQIRGGLVGLRSRNAYLLYSLLSRAIMRNLNPESRVFYLHANHKVLPGTSIDFVDAIAQRLGIEKSLFMKMVNVIDFSSPSKTQDRWDRIEGFLGEASFFILDSTVGEVLDQVRAYCEEKGKICFVVDTPFHGLGSNLEKYANVLVDLHATSNGVEVYMKKHPIMPEALFLMSSQTELLLRPI